MSLQKAIVDRKIKPYNIETYLKGLSHSVTAKEFKRMTEGTKKDVYKEFFVENNKPISTLPTEPSTKLNYGSSKKKDHDIMGNGLGVMHRRSCSDLQSAKNNKNLMSLKSKLVSKLPSIYKNHQRKSHIKNASSQGGYQTSVDYQKVKSAKQLVQNGRHTQRKTKPVHNVELF